MRINLVILLLLAFFSCKEKKHPKDEKVYLIIHRNDSLIKAKEELPLKFFYGDYNFILANKQTVFFYRARWIRIACGTGKDFTKPGFLYLTPDSLKAISVDSLESFLKFNLNDYDVLASIASPNDTIKNPAFPIITKYFQKNNIQRYAIRLLTEEEYYVSQAKLQKKPYNPDSINWEIGFDSRLIPPVLTE